MTIFDEQISRKPDHYPWARDFTKAMYKGMWTDEEFTFSSDKQDFAVTLTEEEKGVLIRDLSAIGQIEIDVKTFWARLGDNLPHPSIRDLGFAFANVEVIHNMAYERLLDELDLSHVFEDNLNNEILLGRVKYLKKHCHRYYSNSKKQFLYSLVLFTLFIENVSLFSQFYVVLWFKRYRNALKDTSQQVNYTKREEDLHAKAGIALINQIKRELPELWDDDLVDRIKQEVQEAVKSEKKIINWILGGFKAERISEEILLEYIKDRMNQSMEAIGIGKIFDIDPEMKRDFEWMDEECTSAGSVDFFFQKPTGYNRLVTIDEEDLI